MLNREVFPTKEAGDYLNDKFIVKKYQLNRGDEDNILETYGIRVYPTLIFVDTNGKELYRMIGSKVRDTEDFISKVKVSLLKENSLESRDIRFKSDPSYAIEHIQFLFDSNRNKEANESLATVLNRRSIKENFNTESVKFYDNSVKDIESPIVQYMLSNKKDIIEIIGKDKFTTILHNIANEYISVSAYGNKYVKDDFKKKLDKVGENKMLKSYFYKFMCEVEAKSINRDFGTIIEIANKYNKKAPSKDRFGITRSIMAFRTSNIKPSKENLASILTFFEQAAEYEKDENIKKSYLMFANIFGK